VPIILDVRDRESMADVMKRYTPAAVFHAAAHKHVPLMEFNVLEALRNNVLGTQSVVDAALAADVEHLVLISTDKAVRPTSVMGASKRIAEQIVQIAARDSGRAYVSVRFGNVLGSRGSVVPTFLRQIRSGGPVLITHPEMRRFFMTIPEAVQLVLQAFALGKNGEVFCLDMGEPVTILSLARDLIQLSGLEPYTDIDIQFTGARPGEKLYEEMFFGAEEASPTGHPKILASRKTQLHPDAQTGIATLRHSLEHTTCAEEAALRATIRTLVEDFGTDNAPKVSKEVLNGNGRRPEVTTPGWSPRVVVDAGLS
jgi:FlaA1/EpsC-like NDP-sugar epimerase